MQRSVEKFCSEETGDGTLDTAEAGLEELATTGLLGSSDCGGLSSGLLVKTVLLNLPIDSHLLGTLLDHDNVGLVITLESLLAQSVKASQAVVELDAGVVEGIVAGPTGVVDLSTEEVENSAEVQTVATGVEFDEDL